MLAALAGGSLPMIMRSFMEPEKPDIEIGTVSFKSKLDEIIKNFVQLWPLYDFPFDVLKSLPENEAEQEERADKEHDQERNKKQENIIVTVPRVNEETKLETQSINGGASVSTTAAKVCFLGMIEVDNSAGPKVDWVVHLPETYDDFWLDEWSDLADNVELDVLKSSTNSVFKN